MAETYDFDVAVVGSGPAGYVAGIRAAQLGARACVIEKGHLGGVCTNVGCIPTKALWHTASTALRLERAAEIGLRVGDVSVDWPALAKRRDKILDTLRGGIKGLLSGNKVELIQAEAAFADPHTLKLTGADGRDTVSAARIFIATGSRPVELKSAPFDHKAIIDSSDAVSANDLPDSVLIIGGGYIGLEFANIYTACGVEVTVVEALDRLLPAMDEDCARVVTKTLKQRKVPVHTGKRLEKVESGEDGVRATLSDGTEIEAQRMLVCVGRKPDTGGVDIAAAGLEAGEKGELVVNEHLQTAQPHIYAIGDVTGRAMLAHVGSYEGTIAAAHATGTISARMDYRVVPGLRVRAPGGGDRRHERGGGEGGGGRDRREEVPLPRARQGALHRRDRGAGEDDLRRLDRADTGRAHVRAGRQLAAGRGRAGDQAGVHGRGAGRHDPHAPDAAGVAARGGGGGGGDADQLERVRPKRRCSLFVVR